MLCSVLVVSTEAMDIKIIMGNLDNPSVQAFTRSLPELQRDLEQAQNEAWASLKVAKPEGDPILGTMVPVERGISGNFDDCSGSVLNLALSYTDPRVAVGIAFFGLGLVVLPLIAKLHGVDNGSEVEKVGVREAVGFKYSNCKKATSGKDAEKPLTLDELERRLGSLDPSSLASEILCQEVETNGCTDEEIKRIQSAVIRARVAVRRLRRRSALAFMGLTPDASLEEVHQRYKRMALEIHPDKGGDAERFQQLQDMKDRVMKSIQEEDDEEEKNNAQEEADNNRLPPVAKAEQLRREAHKEAKKLWDAAREVEAEMLADTSILKGSPGPVLNRLRAFVLQFSNSKCRTLPHGNKDAARSAFQQFKKDGLELIATAALLDPSTTASIIEANINYKIVSRSGSKQVASETQSLLVAIADVQRRAESFLTEVGRECSEALHATGADAVGEEVARDVFRPSEEVTLFGPEAGEDPSTRGVVLGCNAGGVAVQLDSGRRIVLPRSCLARAPSRPLSKDGAAVQQAEGRRTPGEAAPPPLLRRADAPLAVPSDPERQQWDPEFAHPCAGAMDGAGTGVFCRACCSWIATRNFAHEPFLRHARAAHGRPAPGPVDCGPVAAWEAA